MPDTLISSDHLGPGEVTAFVAAGPQGPLGDRAVAHLAQCAECREEILQVSRLVRAPARRQLTTGALMAAAAAVVLTAWLGLRQPQAVDQQRVDPGFAGSVNAVQLIAPLGQVTSDAPLRFSWRGVAGAVEYRLTLLDAQGDVVWSDATLDTVAVLPIETSLVRGPSYYWFVDVLRSDGGSATSGAREFLLTR